MDYNEIFENLGYKFPFKIKYLKAEKTRLVKNYDDVEIYFDTIANLCFAFSTLNLNKKTDIVDIKLTPLIQETGVMLDCSRNAVINIESAKKLIRELAKLGYTYLELYTEDNLEIEKEPYFGYGRGRFSGEEIRLLDNYAKKFGMELVACTQTLAHMWAMFKWEEYGGIHDNVDIMLIDEERTYELIENIISFIASNFSSKRINIGMDEADMVGLGEYLKKHGYVDRFELMLRHLNRVIDICEKYGLKPEMWSDMFFRLAFGEYYVTNKVMPENICKLVPKNARLIYWDYYSDDKKIYDNMLDLHKQISDNVSFAGGAWKCHGFVPHNAVSLPKLRMSMQSAIAHNLSDYMVTCWGDDGAECSPFTLLPCFIDVAINRYNVNIDKNDFSKALYGYTFDEFMLFDSLDLIEKENLEINPTKYLLFNDPIIGLLDRHLKADTSEHYHDVAKKLTPLANIKGDYQYLYQMYLNLALVLEYKCDLGVKLRQAYQANNLEELKKHLSVIDLIIYRLKAFYKTHKTQWFYENRTIGFEIEDVRLGGLISRLKTVKSLLQDFIKGKIKKIEELEGKVLPFKQKSGYILYNRYRENISNMWL